MTRYLIRSNLREEELVLAYSWDMQSFLGGREEELVTLCH